METDVRLTSVKTKEEINEEQTGGGGEGGDKGKEDQKKGKLNKNKAGGNRLGAVGCCAYRRFSRRLAAVHRGRCLRTQCQLHPDAGLDIVYYRLQPADIAEDTGLLGRIKLVGVAFSREVGVCCTCSWFLRVHQDVPDLRSGLASDGSADMRGCG